MSTAPEVEVISAEITRRLADFRNTEIQPMHRVSIKDSTHSDLFHEANRFVWQQILCQFWETLTMVYHLETPVAREQESFGADERSLYGFAIYIMENKDFTFNIHWIKSALRRVTRTAQIETRARRYQITLDSLMPDCLHRFAFSHLYSCHNCCEVTSMSPERLVILNGLPGPNRLKSIEELEKWLRGGVKFPLFYMDKTDFVPVALEFLVSMQTVNWTTYNFASSTSIQTVKVKRIGHVRQKEKRQAMKQVNAASKKRKRATKRKELDDSDNDVQLSDETSSRKKGRYQMRSRRSTVKTFPSKSDGSTPKIITRNSTKRKLEMLDSSSEEIDEENETTSSSSSGSERGRSHLLGHPTDTLTASCKIVKPLRNILTSPSNPSLAMTQEICVDTETGRLIENFTEILENSKFSDVTIIVKDEKFSAHKLVLATRSSVFAAMFENEEMDENKKNVIEIDKMEPSIVKGMLEFIYTDNVSNLDEISNELLLAADEYDLVRLRALCEESLAKTISNETAVEILLLADLHHSVNLKNYVMHFMENHLADMTNSEDYKKLEKYPRLLMEFFCFIAQRKSQKS